MNGVNRTTTFKSEINFFKDNDKLDRGFDESNYHFINISHIFKNENYGEVFIIFNKPSPLFLRVKSRIAKLFLLNKKHVLYLSQNFPNIWKRIFKKSLENMIALKNRTIEFVQKYSLRYDIKTVPKNQGFMTTKLTSPKMKNFSSALTKAFAKNIFHVPVIKVTPAEDTTSIKKESENTGEKNSITKSSAQNISDIPKEIMNKNSSLENSSTFTSKESSSKSASLDESDKSYIRKLKLKLKKEIEKRKYYQKLYNELKKKNKFLYSQLLTKSVLSPNAAIENDNENDNSNSVNNVDDTNVNKIILNEINNNNNLKNLTKRSFSVRFNENKKMSLNALSPKINRGYLKCKTKKLARKKSYYNSNNKKKHKNITNNYFNITKNIKIINNFEKKENLKIKEKIKNKEEKQNNIYIEKILNKKNIKKNEKDINDLSDFNNLSQNTLFNLKNMEKEEGYESRESKETVKKNKKENKKIKKEK